MLKPFKRIQLLTILLIKLLIISPIAFAEDIEIFSNVGTPKEPNVLIILDNSGSMGLDLDDGSDTRIDALRKAFSTFIESPEIKDINIGLMGFSGGSTGPRPHGVSVPISPIDAPIEPILTSNLVPSYLSTGSNFGYFSLADDNLPNPNAGDSVRQYLPQILADWEPRGGTPIVDSLHEAAYYFKGMPPKWGAVSAEQINAAHPSSYTGVITATGSQSNKINTGSALYNTPITEQCQSNTIILMSDGSPNAEGGGDQSGETRLQIKNLIGRVADCAPVQGQVLPVSEYNQLADGRCGPELLKYLATEDQNTSVEGDNLIKTYTIGFAVGDRPEAKAYLESLAVGGNGKYFGANDSASLVKAFMSITGNVTGSARSFAAPVYTVDPTSALSHSDDVYLPMFKNSEYPAWSGNLKKFKLDASGQIIDSKGDIAIDETGQLKADAIDFWMPSGSVPADDADPITSGGFANNLLPASRKLLTNNGSSLLTLDDNNVSKRDLGHAGMSDDQKSKLLNYIKGYEDDGVTPRRAIGDILHSKPTLISYGSKQVLFFGTNEGFLHAVDAADASNGGGVEKFAFMPASLLGNIQGIHTNTVMPAGGLKRIYGVDGTITAHIVDNNNNGKVDGNDTATLIFGLRRGGKEYYALDVTDPDSPSLKWTISKFGRFSSLGETWSKPIPAKLRYLEGNEVTLANVLVFGGGYDNRLDEETPTERSNLAAGNGNGVYIVDMENGNLIWSYSGNKLEHSVPGNIRVLDIDGDNSIDRLYFGDTGGNIWRVDLNADDSKEGHKAYDIKNNSRLTHFASLGGSGTDARKFFFEPDVSIFKDNGKEALVIAIGSGYRAHPLNDEIDDRFYVLSDEDVRSTRPEETPALTDNDLVTSTDLNGNSFLLDKKGWYKPLTAGSGEKVLASPITFMQQVAFTTFAVNTGLGTTITDSNCMAGDTNMARAYVLDLLTGAATADLDGDGVVDAGDESILVESGDILDTPQLYFNEPSNCNSEGCDHYVDLRVGKKITPLINRSTEGGDNNFGDYLPRVYWVVE